MTASRENSAGRGLAPGTSSFADVGVRNSQPEGIGRLEILDGLLVVNNLGRNVVVARIDGNVAHLLSCYGDTVFPGEDEPSQFDLDMHALLRGHGSKRLMAINHIGLVRLLPLDRVGCAAPSVHGNTAAGVPRWEYLRWRGDIEQAVAAGRCIISTSPRGHAVSDPPQPGVLVSEPLPGTESLPAERDLEPVGNVMALPLHFKCYLAERGMTTALAISPSGHLLAVASGTLLTLLPLATTGDGRMICGFPLWEKETRFHCKWLSFISEGVLAGAGHAPADGVADSDWEALTGGGFTLFDSRSGSALGAASFDVDLAWGNGGVPLALYREGKRLVGADRFGGIHTWALKDKGRRETLLAPFAHSPLGIGHLVTTVDTAWYGYNRAGYRLFSCGLERRGK